MSQKEAVYNCSDGITPRVKPQPLHDRSVGHTLLASSSEASAATAKRHIWEASQNVAFAHEFLLASLPRSV